jgi:hypothetical protein
MKRKLNYIDGLIIILVLVVLAGGVWYLTKDDGEGGITTRKTEVVYKAEAKNVVENALEQIQVGDRLVAMGSFQDAEIIDIEYRDAYVVEAIEGQLEAIEQAGLKDIIVTIRGKANQYGPYIDLGGQEIKAGSKYYIKTDVFEAYGNVVEVTSIN